jgi:transcriptional regulator with XRE-family HTH domain
MRQGENMTRPPGTSSAAPERAAAAELRIVGRTLRRLRDARGLTQKELATRGGVDDTSIFRIERGRSGLQWLTLRSLLRALDTNPHRLADAIEKEERNAAAS